MEKNSIKELRDMTGLSQKDFAEKYKIPLPTLRGWEQGQRKPPTYVLYYLYLLINDIKLEDNKDDLKP